MKKLATVALLALALTGCTAMAGDTPEATSAQPVAVAVEPTPTATPTPTKPVDLKAAKAEAIAAGRPEAAWDKKCVAWEMPKADTKGQAWANKLGAEFLESRHVECPDQITMPYYYIETFEPGAPGELVVRVGPEMNRILGNPPSGRYFDLEAVAKGVMDGVMDDNPEVKKVTALTPTGKKGGSASRAQAKEARNEGGLY